MGNGVKWLDYMDNNVTLSKITRRCAPDLLSHVPIRSFYRMLILRVFESRFTSRVGGVVDFLIYVSFVYVVIEICALMTTEVA